VGERHERGVGHFFGRVADQVAVPLVDPDEPAAARVDQRHTDGRLLKDRAEPRLAVAQPALGSVPLGDGGGQDHGRRPDPTHEELEHE
jgi:hypothetical protein